MQTTPAPEAPSPSVAPIADRDRISAVAGADTVAAAEDPPRGRYPPQR